MAGKKTWITVIQQNEYALWPGLDEHMVQRHSKVREPTVLGHMNAQQSGTETTKKKKRHVTKKENSS